MKIESFNYVKYIEFRWYFTDYGIGKEACSWIILLFTMGDIGCHRKRAGSLKYDTIP